MTKKIIFNFFFLCFTVLLAEAQDSLGTIAIKEKVYTLHHVSKKETLYSLSKKYKISIDDIIKYNPSAKDSVILPGEILKVPEWLRAEEIVSVTIPQYIVKKTDTIFHVIKKGETLYSIKRKYPVNNLDSLRIWNDLQADAIKLEQRLIVGWVYDTTRVDSNLIFFRKNDDSIPMNASNLMTDSLHKLKAATKSYVELYKTLNADEKMIVKRQKGLATWLNSKDSPKGFYALHSTLPRETVIRVSNLMNNEVIYVKVIGTLPATQENNKILLKLSYDAARYLGVLDRRFLAEINYHEQK